MTHRPYDVEDQDRGTLALLEPPGPPDYPLTPGDMPPGGWPEGDRAWIHLIWEAFLFFVVLGLFVVVRNAEPGAFRGDQLDEFVIRTSVLGLVGTALAFSLRAAVPNLAVGAIATMAGAATAQLVSEAGYGYTAAIAMAVAGAAALGLVLATVVVAFNVPSWAVTLGAGVALGGALSGLLGSDEAQLGSGVPDVFGRPWLWAGLFISISVVGGLFWLVSSVRWRLGGRRHDGDPGQRPWMGGVVGSVLALVVSSAVAGGAGVLSALRTGSVAPQADDFLTYTALAAVLIGGVSVFGRRAGVFGTVLGVLLLSLVQEWLIIENVDPWVFVMAVGGAIVVGLLVTRALETAGRRRVY